MHGFVIGFANFEDCAIAFINLGKLPDIFLSLRVPGEYVNLNVNKFSLILSVIFLKITKVTETHHISLPLLIIRLPRNVIRYQFINIVYSITSCCYHLISITFCFTENQVINEAINKDLAGV